MSAECTARNGLTTINELMRFPNRCKNPIARFLIKKYRMLKKVVINKFFNFI